MVEQLKKVLSKTAVVGTLQVKQSDGKVAGWIVDTWTERGIEPHLRPHMHWVSREDGKFYHMRLNIDFQSSILLLDEDTEIEPNRVGAIRKMLGRWEQEWLEQEAKQL